MNMMSKTFAVVFTFALCNASSLMGQTSDSVLGQAMPVLLKRSPATTTPADVNLVPAKTYPFGEISAKLKSSSPEPIVPPPTPAIVRSTESTVPASYVAKADVALTATGQEAVALSKKMVGQINCPDRQPQHSPSCRMKS